MSRYVALLRGVNVGGHGRVSMADLRRAFVAMGAGGVDTYIQSGNVLFTPPAGMDLGSVGPSLQGLLGRAVEVVLRTGPELAEVIRANPFPDRDPAHLHVGFLVRAPAAGWLDGVDLTAFTPEEAAPAGTHVYFHLPNGMGRARLPARVEREVRGAMTVRNWRTVARLATLL